MDLMAREKRRQRRPQVSGCRKFRAEARPRARSPKVGANDVLEAFRQRQSHQFAAVGQEIEVRGNIWAGTAVHFELSTR
jgi:hypothetical protein